MRKTQCPAPHRVRLERARRPCEWLRGRNMIWAERRDDALLMAALPRRDASARRRALGGKSMWKLVRSKLGVRAQKRKARTVSAPAHRARGRGDSSLDPALSS